MDFLQFLVLTGHHVPLLGQLEGVVEPGQKVERYNKKKTVRAVFCSMVDPSNIKVCLSDCFKFFEAAIFALPASSQAWRSPPPHRGPAERADWTRSASGNDSWRGGGGRCCGAEPDCCPRPAGGQEEATHFQLRRKVWLGEQSDDLGPALSKPDLSEEGEAALSCKGRDHHKLQHVRLHGPLAEHRVQGDVDPLECLLREF